MVGATVAAFPSAKVVWRSMHWPSDKDAKVDWFMGWNYGDEKKHRPFFHHNRILQLGTSPSHSSPSSQTLTDLLSAYSRRASRAGRHLARQLGRGLPLGRGLRVGLNAARPTRPPDVCPPSCAGPLTGSAND
jgi:hypothetical protein